MGGGFVEQLTNGSVGGSMGWLLDDLVDGKPSWSGIW